MPRDRDRGQQLLAEIQPHLEYEVQMLFGTAALLQNLPHATLKHAKQRCIHYALLEAFVIHARALIDFLYTPPSAKPDDVLAEHFLVEELARCKWKKDHSTLPPLLDEARKRAGKELAHLSYVRASIAPDDKNYAFAEIAQTILSELGEWIKLAPQDKVSDSLAQSISHGIAALSKTPTGRTVASTNGYSGVKLY